MPVYFFNVRNHVVGAEDKLGQDLVSLEAAVAEAHKDIVDIKRARFEMLGVEWTRWSIEICDKQQRVLKVVPFTSN